MAKATKIGVPLVLMTPTAFDSLSAVPLIVDAPPYYFKSFYRNYDSVLIAYGNSVLSFRTSTQMVIDIQNPLRVWAKAQRQTDPEFAWTAEGVHPIPAGHQAMADAIYAALFASATAVVPGMAAPAARNSAVSLAAGRKGYLVNGAMSDRPDSPARPRSPRFSPCPHASIPGSGVFPKSPSVTRRFRHGRRPAGSSP